MRFPIEEEKIITLGKKMSSGLKANSDIYPNPPVNTLDLDEILVLYEAKVGEIATIESSLAQAFTEKQELLQTASDRIKRNLRYAEQAVDFNDDKLKAIGWGGREKPTPLAAPGRTLDLVAAEQGGNWVKLQWKKPADGGKVAAYKVLCRERAAGEWKSQDTAISLELTLREQPKGTELEYCVIALNKAGEGPMSNVVMAVL